MNIRNHAAIRRNGEKRCIDMAEKLLGEKAIRDQGVFDWLRGDKGTKLRVDAYFHKNKVVIEYHGKQHDIPNRLMDRRPGRRNQRLRYDKLRRRLIPQHGFHFVEVSWNDEK